MDAQAEKKALIKGLEKIDDESLIRAIQSMIDYANRRDEEYLGVTVDQYNSELEDADTRIEKGEFIAHDEAIKRIKGWRARQGK